MAKFSGSAPKNHETHLLSGAIVIIKNAPVSLLASKQKLLDLYQGSKKNKNKRQPSQEVKGNSWIFRLINLSRPKDMDLQDVCDEYVSTVLQFKMRPVSRRLKKLIIEMQTDREAPTEKCEYSILQRMQLVAPDRRVLLKKPHSFQWLKMKSGKKLLFASLSRTRRQDIKQVIEDYMIIVPVKLSDNVSVGNIVEQAVQKLNTDSKTTNRVVRFRVLKSGSVPGNFRLPGLSVMAFTNPNGKIILVNEVKYQVSYIRKVKTDKAVLGEFVTVHLFNSNLAKALAAGDLSTYKAYIKKSLYEDSRKALDVAGRYAAAQFDVSKIVVISKVAVPGRRFGLSVPVRFERKNRDWIITNRPKK